MEINPIHALARGFLNDVQTPYGSVRLAGAGFRIGAANFSGHTLALPGAHNDEVLAGLGFDDAQIAALRHSKVIGTC